MAWSVQIMKVPELCGDRMGFVFRQLLNKIGLRLMVVGPIGADLLYQGSQFLWIWSFLTQF